MHTFADPLSRAVRTGAERTAVVCGADRVTYADMWRRCRALAGAMRGLGLEHGDRVAVVMANCHRYLEIYQALPASGLVIVPLNLRHTEHELRYVIEDSGARALITDREPGGLAEIVERVVRIPDDYEALVADGPEVDLGEGVSEDDLAGLFYTGGTTGAAKGVMLTQRNLIANTIHTMLVTRLRSGDTWLVMAPLFHAAGSFAVLANVWLGNTQVLLPAFDPAAVLDLIEAEAVTATLGVPTMIGAMLEEQSARARDVTSLRLFAHGASPIATETLRRVRKFFPDANILHLYGATETAPLATGLFGVEDHIDDPLARSCGQPVVGVSIRVVDDDMNEQPAGMVGEVAIRGPNVMKGYWNKPEQTAAVLVDGWYRSGDLGYADDESHLFLVDRAKDMIVTGGENVYCTEVEEALYTHPMVLECAAFGIPDEKWGEAVMAVVVPRGEVTEDDLVAHCRQRIAGYKVPKRIVVQEEALPKSGAGKILKRELREPYWEGRTERISGS